MSGAEVTGTDWKAVAKGFGTKLAEWVALFDPAMGNERLNAMLDRTGDALRQHMLKQGVTLAGARKELAAARHTLIDYRIRVPTTARTGTPITRSQTLPRQPSTIRDRARVLSAAGVAGEVAPRVNASGRHGSNTSTTTEMKIGRDARPEPIEEMTPNQERHRLYRPAFEG